MNTAVIGLGPHGLRLVKAASELPGSEVIAVADTNRERLELPELSNVPHKVASLADLWKLDLRVDLLVVATNGPSHASISLNAIQHGIKKLLVCKPLACSLAEANALMSAAKVNGVVVAVDHGLRYDRTYRWIVDKLRETTWGKLLSVYIQRPGIGMGCLGVHSFDLANFLFGAVPERVTGWLDAPRSKNPRGEHFIDPGGLAVLNYSGERKAVIVQNEEGSGPMSVEINCQLARIRVDEKFKTLEIVQKDRNVVHAPDRPAPMVRETNPEGITPDHDTTELMKRIIQDLITGGEVRAKGEFGLRSVEILSAVYHSQASGNIPVALPLQEKSAIEQFLPVT